MNYCILNAEGIIENIIVCENDAAAAEFGAVASYDGASIGAPYAPPAPEPETPADAEPVTWATMAAAIRAGVNEV